MPLPVYWQGRKGRQMAKNICGADINKKDLSEHSGNFQEFNNLEVLAKVFVDKAVIVFENVPEEAIPIQIVNIQDADELVKLLKKTLDLLYPHLSLLLLSNNPNDRRHFRNLVSSKEIFSLSNKLYFIDELVSMLCSETCRDVKLRKIG